MATNLSEEIAIAKQLKRKFSEVHPLDNAGKVQRGYQIWSDLAPSVVEKPEMMFAKCVIQTGSTKEKLVCVQVEPKGYESKTFEISYSNAWNTNSQLDPLSYGDIGMLPHTSVPCVLDYLKQRFLKNQIYTTADPLLVAINPYKDLKNTTPEWIQKYRDASDHRKLPPHVFYTSREALDSLYGINKSQTIIVSGESGSGKTEATKQIMRYFATSKHSTMDARIQNAVMAANPVLEAFGNAKTIRNNNSSRFGRFMNLNIGREGGIKHGNVIAFLLEKSRVLIQSSGERNYHIFYQFIKGSSAEIKSKYNLLTINDYTYINKDSIVAPGIDDVADYKECLQSFEQMNLSELQQNTIWSCLSGILMLGNVKISKKELNGVPDAAVIEGDSVGTFRKACELLFLDYKKLEKELTIKTTYAGGNKVEGHWGQKDADMLKSSLAKAVYEKMFHYIIKHLNSIISTSEEYKFIGLLDIFGFEVFPSNSLEQFFINITNEMLQKNFVDIVFDRESKLYKSEGITTADLVFTSNDVVIDLLTAKNKSILAVLEDQCLSPGGTDERFVSNLVSTFKGNSCFEQSKKSSSERFIVVHTIGPITYNSKGFLFKNKDVLRGEIMDLINESENAVCREFFAGTTVERGKIAKGQLIGSQFLTQLTQLMKLICETEPHFIRCVKPNEEKAPLVWSPSKILIQLHALSILEALGLRQLGFPYRRTFEEFLFQFKFVNIGITANPALRGNNGVSQLLEYAGITKKDYQIGKTMIFMKNTASKELTKFQQEKLSAWIPIVEIIECAIIRIQRKKVMAKKIPAILRLQAHVRKHMASNGLPVQPPSTIKAGILTL